VRGVVSAVSGKLINFREAKPFALRSLSILAQIRRAIFSKAMKAGVFASPSIFHRLPSFLLKIANIITKTVPFLII
jgi:hypothetical protein